jgi:hypothetical protein
MNDGCCQMDEVFGLSGPAKSRESAMFFSIMYLSMFSCKPTRGFMPSSNMISSIKYQKDDLWEMLLLSVAD